MRRPIQTPEWMLEAIRAATPSIVAMHGAAMLPSSPDVLGCGCFGCVFPTHKRSWVLKVTIEGSEAFFARCQVNIDHVPPGVCKYLHPLRVSTEAGPVWLVWRQAVSMPDFSEWLYENCGMPQRLRDRLDELHWGPKRDFQKAKRLELKWIATTGCDAEQEVKALQQCGMGVSFGLHRFMSTDGQPADFANVLKYNKREANRLFKPHYHLHYWRYTDSTPDDYILNTAVDLLAYQFHLDRLKKNKIASHIGHALDFYLSKGLMVGDPQPDNIAQVNGVWTVYDLGFTVPVHPRWDLGLDGRGRQDGALGSRGAHPSVAATRHLKLVSGPRSRPARCCCEQRPSA